MDIDTIDGRMDFFLLLLASDRISRLKTRKGFSQIEFNLHLQLTCDKDPKIDQDVFLIDLLDNGYVARGAYGDGLPLELTKEGYDFIMSGGFSERERKRLLELKKDEKLEVELDSAIRTKKWFYPLLIISLMLNAILIATNSITLHKVLSPNNSGELKPTIDTVYIAAPQEQPSDSSKTKTPLP